jgi:hypothetical protein
MKGKSELIVIVLVVIIGGIFCAGCTENPADHAQSGTGQVTQTVQTQASLPTGAGEPARTPTQVQDQKNLTGVNPEGSGQGIPPTGMAMNGTPPSGNPPGNMTMRGGPMNGTPPSGSPPQGQAQGTPPSGSPPSGSPPQGQ